MAPTSEGDPLKILKIVTASILLVSFESFASGKSYFSDVSLKQAEPCILNVVAKKSNVVIKPELPIPDLMLEQNVDMEQYKKDVQEWFGFEIDQVTNFFFATKNKIYLITDNAYYTKTNRSPYDSLAHELTHYIQWNYQGATKDDLGTDGAEMSAIDVQTWFRETYKLGPKSIITCKDGDVVVSN
jgi:hypothetical protein